MVKRGQRDSLFRNISNDITEDLLALSDAEVQEEAQDFYDDPKARVASLRKQADSLIMASRKKNRLIPAIEELARSSDDRTLCNKIMSWPIETISSLIDKAFGGRNDIPEGLVLQYRKKKDLSKEDLVHLIENLHDLGLINDDDL